VSTFGPGFTLTLTHLAGKAQRRDVSVFNGDTDWCIGDGQSDIEGTETAFTYNA
jgi:hypothetical protein